MSCQKYVLSKICPVEKVSLDNMSVENMSVENMSVEKMSRCCQPYIDTSQYDVSECSLVCLIVLMCPRDFT